MVQQGLGVQCGGEVRQGLAVRPQHSAKQSQVLAQAHSTCSSGEMH